MTRWQTILLAALCAGCSAGASPAAFVVTDAAPIGGETGGATDSDDPGVTSDDPVPADTATGPTGGDTSGGTADSASIPDSTPGDTGATEGEGPTDTGACGALDVPGNGVDDDCDGAIDEDEGGGTGGDTLDPVSDPDTQAPSDTGIASDPDTLTDVPETDFGNTDSGDTGALPSDTGDPATDTGPCAGVYVDGVGREWTYAGLAVLQEAMDTNPCATLETCGGGWDLPTWEDVKAAAVPDAPGDDWQCYWTFLPPQTPEAWPWQFMPAQGASYFLEWGLRIYHTARCNGGRPVWDRVGGDVEVQTWCVR